MITIKAMADDLELLFREKSDHASNLERAIELKHVRRPISDVHIIRWRLPALLAACNALRALESWRDRLPPEFIAEIEKD